MTIQQLTSTTSTRLTHITSKNQNKNVIENRNIDILLCYIGLKFILCYSYFNVVYYSNHIEIKPNQAFWVLYDMTIWLLYVIIVFLVMFFKERWTNDIVQVKKWFMEIQVKMFKKPSLLSWIAF